MRYTLKDYQFSATADITKALRRATKNSEDDPNDRWAGTLSAPTGAGKTVIASAVIETLFDGNEQFAADPLATVLWVTDDPALNAQTKRNMNQASSTLGPGRLITIDSSFDEEQFETNNVYFLNIQKLARSNPLARSNTENRGYSLWQTIANTIAANGPHFYVIIDEAHRGMKVESDRQTIVSRIINGQPGINPPAPIVLGISATPERFKQAMAKWSEDRNTRAFSVSIEAVRLSGLLKDKIVLANPKKGQIGGDTTFIRAAVDETIKYEAAWHKYATRQNEPAVIPALVVQIQNKPSDAEMSEILGAIFDSWEGLLDKNVVNTFGEHTALNVAGHAIGYMTPQDIQDDTDVRVILCKDAISTGWDCPRAEVLVSLRVANDYTYIAQMIGRMVRTPLARKIATDQTLNDVHCYLPRFRKAEVDKIVAKFKDGSNDEPPVEMVIDPVTVEHNTDNVPDEVYTQLADLPTYVVPGRVYRTQVARVHTLATLLSGDHIVDDAIEQTKIQLVGVLRAQHRRLESDGSFQRDLKRLRSLRIERSYVLLSAESFDDLPDDQTLELERDDNNIEDLYRVAQRKLPEGVATNYWNEVINAQSDDDYDPTEAKAETAVLALHDEVVEAVEASAEQLAKTWLREHQRSISKLPDAKKALYDPVKRETRNPELSELILPSARNVPDSDQRWPKHVLAAEDGTYPFAAMGWELKVIEIEMKDDDLVAWYRNPTGGSSALRIPYAGSEFDKSMYPDFVMFHQTDEGIRPSIIDPHGFHLADAVPKLRGLASYAEAHGDAFARIDAVVEINKRLLTLDLKSESVRDAVRKVDESGLEDLFKKLAGAYS